MTDKCPDKYNCPASESAANKAVHKVFAILGVDVDDPKQVQTFQENLRFGAAVRRTASRAGYGILTAIITITIASILVKLFPGLMR